MYTRNNINIKLSAHSTVACFPPFFARATVAHVVSHAFKNITPVWLSHKTNEYHRRTSRKTATGSRAVRVETLYRTVELGRKTKRLLSGRSNIAVVWHFSFVEQFERSFIYLF